MSKGALRTKENLIADKKCIAFARDVVLEINNDQIFISALRISKNGFYGLLENYKYRYGISKGGRPAKVDTTQAFSMILQFFGFC